MNAHELPRVRQAVLAAHSLEDLTEQLSAELGLREPHHDPGVAYFGLRNAVFALGDTFLEVVSPVRPGTSAGRLLERRGGDCGYMVMIQVDDLEAARTRAHERGVREVFEVALDDIDEVHLHPADMSGAIVSLSRATPPSSWRWAGQGWEARSAPLVLSAVAIAVADPDSVAERWDHVLGCRTSAIGIEFRSEQAGRGLVEVTLSGLRREPVELGGIRFRAAPPRGPR